jgi:hypothetical protein
MFFASGMYLLFGYESRKSFSADCAFLTGC